MTVKTFRRLPAIALAAVAVITPVLAGTPSQAATLQADEGVTAAEKFGWTDALNREDNFDTLDPAWGLYDGPGHAGNGVRSPEQVGVQDGILRIDGTEDGTTGGMAWDEGQLHGRWETRAKYTAGTSAYHQVLILWPDAEDFPVGGEIDYSEVSDSERQNLQFFLHYGENNDQVQSETAVDMTQWHNYAVEWTPEHIIGYVDGVEFFRSEDPKTLPPRAMHPTIQLDWFPEDGEAGPGSMEVDWIRQYTL
ncbi:glycoside hydrolase family 16 protein [Amycolatopsis antarctica]|uniref:glycoside hydrolase family 16 protein n=1 Tax=Amycolatopsis antarctica TaxID=1854586 RepID=UPI0013FD2661|nr:glycoside hydrolase family 16 protein [Amycolatopsis antarctica]